MFIGRCHGIAFAIVFAGCVALSSACGLAQAPLVKSVRPSPLPLSLDQVVDNLIAENVKRFTALEGYQSRRTYTMTYKGFAGDISTQMVVDLDYTSPDTKKFTVVSESGSKFLANGILKKLVDVETESQQAKNRKSLLPNRQNYKFSNLEYQPSPDGCSYIVSVQPVVPNRLLYRGRIWVNDQDFAICRIEGVPSKTPSLWIASAKLTHTYAKIGEFWFSKDDKSVSDIRIGGTALLDIEYGDYKIQMKNAAGTTGAVIGPRK